MTLTPDQLHILQYALGCDEYGESRYKGPVTKGDGAFDAAYTRNSIVMSPFSDLTTLVKAGLLQDDRTTAPLHWYSVTKTGLAAMIAQSPRRPKARAKATRKHPNP